MDHQLILFEHAMLGEIGGLICCPFTLGLFLHINTPFFTANFRTARGEEGKYQACYANQGQTFVGIQFSLLINCI
jgi:hypothetical protein